MSTAQSTLDSFRVPLGEGAPIRRGAFRIKAMYLSNTAMVLDVELFDLKKGTPERDDLAALVRSLTHAAMDHGIQRPVAVVVATDQEEIRRWAFDQDWHRGELLFYAVSQDQHPPLLADLVAEGDVVPVEPRTRQNDPELLDEIRKAVGHEHELLERIRGALGWRSGRDPEGKKAGSEAVQAWTDGVLQEAARMAEQPAPQAPR